MAPPLTCCRPADARAQRSAGAPEKPDEAQPVLAHETSIGDRLGERLSAGGRPGRADVMVAAHVEERHAEGVGQERRGTGARGRRSRSPGRQGPDRLACSLRVERGSTSSRDGEEPIGRPSRPAKGAGSGQGSSRRDPSRLAPSPSGSASACSAPPPEPPSRVSRSSSPDLVDRRAGAAANATAVPRRPAAARRRRPRIVAASGRCGPRRGRCPEGRARHVGVDGGRARLPRGRHPVVAVRRRSTRPRPARDRRGAASSADPSRLGCAASGPSSSAPQLRQRAGSRPCSGWGGGRCPRSSSRGTTCGPRGRRSAWSARG